MTDINFQCVNDPVKGTESLEQCDQTCQKGADLPNGTYTISANIGGKQMCLLPSGSGVGKPVNWAACDDQSMNNVFTYDPVKKIITSTTEGNVTLGLDPTSKQLVTVDVAAPNKWTIFQQKGGTGNNTWVFANNTEPACLSLAGAAAGAPVKSDEMCTFADNGAFSATEFINKFACKFTPTKQT